MSTVLLIEHGTHGGSVSVVQGSSRARAQPQAGRGVVPPTGEFTSAAGGADRARCPAAATPCFLACLLPLRRPSGGPVARAAAASVATATLPDLLRLVRGVLLGEVSV